MRPLLLTGMFVLHEPRSAPLTRQRLRPPLGGSSFLLGLPKPQSLIGIGLIRGALIHSAHHARTSGTPARSTAGVEFLHLVAHLVPRGAVVGVSDLVAQLVYTVSLGVVVLA